MSATDWPKGPTSWKVGRTIYISIPFTWDLSRVFGKISTPSSNYDQIIIGGPAVQLMPHYFDGLHYVSTASHYPGVLQIVNPMATRTTTGCVRRCQFCGIGNGIIEPGGLRELSDWPDLPILCDNNLLAASDAHFDRVMDRLEKYKGVDFNQGLDIRLLTEHHAQRLARLKRPEIRLALDSLGGQGAWLNAYALLRSAGVARRNISSYALIGFNGGVDEAWDRCEWINDHCRCLPMWFHPLDALKLNQVTPEQMGLGWTDKERIRIMRRFYQAKRGGKRGASANG